MKRKHTSLTLHGSDGVSRGGGLLVDHEGLSAHLQILPSHDVKDWSWQEETNKLGPYVVKSTKTNGLLTKLWEDSVQGLLEIILLDLFIKVVYVDCVVWSGRLHVGSLKYIRHGHFSSYTGRWLSTVPPWNPSGCQVLNIREIWWGQNYLPTLLWQNNIFHIFISVTTQLCRQTLWVQCRVSLSP